MDVIPQKEREKEVVEDLLKSLHQLDRLLEEAVSHSHAAHSDEAADPYRGLYVDRTDVERALDNAAADSSLRSQPLDLETFFAEALKTSSTLNRLKQDFGLSLFDLAVVAIALAPEIDLRYERIYAYLQDDVTRKRPTVDLALNLLCVSASEKLKRRSHFTSASPLIAQGLLHLIPDSTQTQPPLLAHYLKLDEQAMRLLLAEQELDSRLVQFSQLSQPRDLLEQLQLNPEIKQTLVALTEQAHQTQKPLCLYFHGIQGVGKERTAAAIANHLGRSLLKVDLLQALELKVDIEPTLKLLFREAQYHNAILYFLKFNEFVNPEQKALINRLLDMLAETNRITILAASQTWQPHITGKLNVIPVSFTMPDFEQRRTYWQVNLAAMDIVLNAEDLDALADRFRLTPAQIQSAVAIACNQNRWDKFQNSDPLNLVNQQPNLNNLFAAARMQSGQDIAAMARKITPKYTLADIILPPDQMVQLQEICDRAKHRAVVYGQWGFDRKLSLGKGLNILFSGSPGTGKTMAAEVIANELQIDLYKIDLSQVVSKYIGETEKSLDRIFTAAQSTNAILFFDEADALFGKRSQVKDAHDRYANIEVGYLLQKMEEYEGVAILATNLQDNMDDAFVRRIHIIIEFPFPDESDRHRIWQVVFPPEAPLGEDVDLGALAREVKLAGGNIKNIGLAAAFYAASDGGVIGMSHLLKAAVREHQKLGRTWIASGISGEV
jgi:SpoVK/Ycf46/Vps4 family AAA+-type ATPase